jgi:hypothetical protein
MEKRSLIIPIPSFGSARTRCSVDLSVSGSKLSYILVAKNHNRSNTNTPFDHRIKQSPTLKTTVPGMGVAETKLPEPRGLSTSSPPTSS